MSDHESPLASLRERVRPSGCYAARGKTFMIDADGARALCPHLRLQEHWTGVRLSRRRFLGAGMAASLGIWAESPGSVAGQTPAATPIATVPEGDAGTPVRGGKVRLLRPGTGVQNFNPAAFAQDPQILQSYLEPLVRPDPITMEPEPWLCEGWTWRNDGLELRLIIREGVSWHDGSRLVAEDAAFSFMVYRDDADSAVSGLFAALDRIEAVSERELEVGFLFRDGNWLYNAATLPIFSQRQYGSFWFEADPLQRSLSRFDWTDSPPLGTGPWQIVDWDDSNVRFAPNLEYWRQGPWLDSLEVGVEPGAHERLEAWDAGQAQIVWPVAPAVISERGVSDEELVAAPAASVMFAAFNFANPNQPAGSLWTDLAVRRAASMAINRERYAREVFGGHIQWDAAGTVAQPWARDRVLQSEAFNREAAAIMLAEAGWLDYDGDGFRENVNGTPLRPVTIVSEGSGPELIAVLARVARDFAEVGIGMTVEVLPEHEFSQRWITRRDYDLIAYAYDLLPGFTDYDLYGSAWDIRTNPAGWNPGGYSNPEADEAIAEFLGAVTMERQQAALSRLQRAVNDDLFGLWFGFPDDLILVAAGVKGFAPDITWQTSQTWELWRAAES